MFFIVVGIPFLRPAFLSVFLAFVISELFYVFLSALLVFVVLSFVRSFLFIYFLLLVLCFVLFALHAC